MSDIKLDANDNDYSPDLRVDFGLPKTAGGYINALLKHEMQIRGVADTLDKIVNREREGRQDEYSNDWNDGHTVAFTSAANTLRNMMKALHHLNEGHAKGNLTPYQLGVVDDFANQVRSSVILLENIAKHTTSTHPHLDIKLLRDAHSDAEFLKRHVVPVIGEDDGLALALRELDSKAASRPALAENHGPAQRYVEAALYNTLDSPNSNKATRVRDVGETVRSVQEKIGLGSSGADRERESTKIQYEYLRPIREEERRHLARNVREADSFVAGVLDENELRKRREDTNPGSEKERLKALYKARMESGEEEDKAFQAREKEKAKDRGRPSDLSLK